MHRLMLIGPLIALFGGGTSFAAFLIGRNATSDAAAFLGGNASSSRDSFFSVLSLIFPYFLIGLAVVSLIYILLFIRRERTRRGGRFLKFISIFMGFSLLWIVSFYGFFLGGFMIAEPEVVVADASVLLYARIIGGGLLAVGVGSFVTFLGCFKA